MDRSSSSSPIPVRVVAQSADTHERKHATITSDLRGRIKVFQVGNPCASLRSDCSVHKIYRQKEEEMGRGRAKIGRKKVHSKVEVEEVER